MTFDADFLKHGETSFRSFYPKGYLLSVVPDPAAAASAATAPRDAGFAPQDIAVTTGEEVLRRHDASMADRGVIERFEQFVSRLHGDEADLLDGLLDLARRGHMFVLAHAPEQSQPARAADAVRSLKPVVLRKYDALTVRDLV
jgi:hypothetical protein